MVLQVHSPSNLPRLAPSASNPSIGFASPDRARLCSFPHPRIDFVAVGGTPAKRSRFAGNDSDPARILQDLRRQPYQVRTIQSTPALEVDVTAGEMLAPSLCLPDLLRQHLRRPHLGSRDAGIDPPRVWLEVIAPSRRLLRMLQRNAQIATIGTGVKILSHSLPDLPTRTEAPGQA